MVSHSGESAPKSRGQPCLLLCLHLRRCPCCCLNVLTGSRVPVPRYNRAAEYCRLGKMSALVINDMDAGLGRFQDTQCTVNQQIAIGQLMNLCDNPYKVALGESWGNARKSMRVPIFITANDLSTMYAPILRDGRMEKFYWKPDRVDLINMLAQMYKGDGFSREDMETLYDSFPGQVAFTSCVLPLCVPVIVASCMCAFL